MELDHVYYDVACLSYPYFGPSEREGFIAPSNPWYNPMKISGFPFYGQYSDYREAFSLYSDIVDECKTDDGFVSKECWVSGTKWSVIYTLNAILFTIMIPL